MNMLKKLPRLALILALLLPVWFLVASLGAKFGLWSKMFGFGTMTATIGPIAAMIIAGLGVLALIVALVAKPRKGWLGAAVAIAIPLAVLAGFNQLRTQAGSVPFIYDITTNPADAPTFSAEMVKAREDADANPLLDYNTPLGNYEKWAGNEELAETTAAQLIAQGYPELSTLVVENSAADVLEVVKDAMEMRGFSGVRLDEAAGTVEGTDELFWYGFQDDVVARVRESEAGTSVDFRSTSRLGTSDLGVNAKRIADLRAAVKDRLAKDFVVAMAVDAEKDPSADEGDQATVEAADQEDAESGVAPTE